jgi:Transposase protein
MVFMLRGLTSSWKQTVAYLFTGASLKREPFWEFTKRVIEASESVGLRVEAVTSDMGPVNTGLWNLVGIQSTRYKVVTKIPHPYSIDRELYFLADPPHLLKNLWNCVLSHKITLSPQTAEIWPQK